MLIPPYFKNGAHAISVSVIGAGGTGSVLLQQLARVHLAMVSKGLKGLLVTAIDPDEVTEANLGRQLFTKEDIGRPKCVVMVERINRFYGTSWMAIPQAFTMELGRQRCFPGNIIITCVDNVKARKVVERYFSNMQIAQYREDIQAHFWIDTGNTFDTGQVVLHKLRSKLPTIFEMYPDMEKDEPKDNMPSCSLAEALGKQSLFINTTVALQASSLVWEIVTSEAAHLKYRGAFINLKRRSPVKLLPV
jgi:PRTRC genetic system ThiF family protein